MGNMAASFTRCFFRSPCFRAGYLQVVSITLRPHHNICFRAVPLQFGSRIEACDRHVTFNPSVENEHALFLEMVLGGGDHRDPPLRIRSLRIVQLGRDEGIGKGRGQLAGTRLQPTGMEILSCRKLIPHILTPPFYIRSCILSCRHRDLAVGGWDSWFWSHPAAVTTPP